MSNGKWTRRTVLGSIATGVVVLASDTYGYSVTELSRDSTIITSSDGNALIALDGFDPSKVYNEPHKVTVENQTNSTLETNKVESTNGDLKFRDTGDTGSSDNPYYFDTNLAPGESYDFEIVTSDEATGDVTDTVTLSLEAPDGISVELGRSITVEFKAGGQLVYALNGDIQVYDAVNDSLNTPPNRANADIIGANAADILEENPGADIPYLTKDDDNSEDVLATSVGASDDEVIDKGEQPKLKKQKTRLALRPWPDASLSGDLILSADDGSEKIIGVDANGNTEEIAEPGDGADGVAGVADIDDDGKVELVFVDSSQQMRYLEQDGTTREIENADVGSNNSAGFGSPVDFGKGDIEIPFIDGSNQPALIDYQGNKNVLIASDVARKAAVAPVDIDGDGSFEFMYLSDDGGEIEYIDDVRGSNNIETLLVNGNTVVPDESAGLNSGATPGN